MTVFPFMPFSRLVQQLGQEWKTKLKWEPGAIAVFEAAVEHKLVGLLEDANRVAISANRTWVECKDIQLVRRLRGERA